MGLRSPLHILAAAALAAALQGCGEEKHSYVPNMGDPTKTPTMVTTEVSTVISDSGYTRYHIEAPIWNMYEDLDDPCWTFPDGIDLEQYDLRMRPEAWMRCDSATYFERQRLWRLDGHVVMVNTQRDTFLTQQLFWDQQRSEVYSDSFIHIVRTRHIIEGYGFTSNQNMTAYTVRRPTAIIPVNRDAAGGAGATGPGANDSAAAARLQYREERPMAPQPASQRYDRQRALSPISASPGATSVPAGQNHN